MTKSNLVLFYFCFFFIILKLISISQTNFNLYGDEAQYWLWSKDLSFGYFSKPPLLSWFIALVTFLFGDSFFVLKIIPVSVYCISSYLIYILTNKLYNNKSLSVCCALTFFLLPSVSLSSFILSTDVILILFWICSLIQLLKIKENPSYFNFIYLGFLLGLAFLAKYAAIYFIISLIILLIVEKKYALVFKKSKLKLLLSLIVLLLMLLPNVLWNYQHGWLTIDHTMNNASLDKINLNPFGFLKFLASQIIMIGVILFIGFVIYSFKKIKINSNEKFLICFSLPALTIVSLEAFLVRAHANWAATSLITLFIFFVYFVYRINKNIIYINNYLNLIVGVVLFVMIGINIPLEGFNRINGLKNFTIYLDKKNQNNIKSFVIDDRLLFANLNYEYKSNEFNFYSPFKPGNKIVHHFQLKNPLPSNFSQNFILIGNKNNINYLKNNNKIVFLGSSSPPFIKQDVRIYEVIFD